MWNEYHFVTRWRVRGSVEEILQILSNAEDLKRWWPSVYLDVKQRDDGIVELFTKGWLPYTLRWSSSAGGAPAATPDDPLPPEE